MADNLKPYDPNKGFISFRLNPEALKEALIEQVPYNRTLRHIYNNPEGDIRETAKVAASETPILGSLLAGEPVDAAKEAFLLATPAKASKARAYIKKHPNRDYYVWGYSGDILAKHGKGYTDISDGRRYPGYRFSNLTKFKDVNEVSNYVNNSERALDFTKQHDLNYVTDVNPFERNNIDKLNQTDRQMRNTAEELMQRSDAIESRNNIQSLVDDANYKGLLNKGEEVYWHPEEYYGFAGRPDMYLRKPNSNYIRSLTGEYGSNRAIADNNKAPMSMFGLSNKDLIKYEPYSPYQSALDKKLLKEDEGLYRAKYADEDNYVSYRDNDQYLNDLRNEADKYRNAVYGPFPDDWFELYRSRTHSKE